MFLRYSANSRYRSNAVRFFENFNKTIALSFFFAVINSRTLTRCSSKITLWYFRNVFNELIVISFRRKIRNKILKCFKCFRKVFEKFSICRWYRRYTFVRTFWEHSVEYSSVVERMRSNFDFSWSKSKRFSVHDVSSLSVCKRRSNEFFIDKKTRWRVILKNIYILKDHQWFQTATILNKRLRQKDCLILEYSL